MAPGRRGSIQRASLGNGKPGKEDDGGSKEDDDFFQNISLKEKRAMYVKTFVQMFTFFVFLAVFTVTVLSSTSTAQQRFSAHVKTLFTQGPMPLQNIRSIDDYWKYIDQTFLPAVYRNDTVVDDAYAQSPKLLPIDLNNRIVGALRMWQVRVKPRTGCQVGALFSNYQMDCFMPLNEFTQFKDDYGPELQYKYSDEVQGSQLHEGLLGQYPSTGHVEKLLQNVTYTRILLNEMKRDNWIAAPTRAVFIDFTVWNSNLNMHAVIRISGEFSASGVVAARSRVIVLQARHLDPLASTGLTDMVALIGEVLLALFVLFYVAEEVTEFTITWRKYFLDPWNVMDWANLGMLVGYITVRILILLEAMGNDLGGAELMDEDVYTPMQGIAERLMMAYTINSFNAVFMWAKVVKYVGFMPYIKTLLVTLEACWKQFFSFLLMYSIIFLSFVVAFMIGFGETISELGKIGSTSVYLARSFLGDIDLTEVYVAAPLFGAFLILFFMLGIYFLMMNVFFAIMLSSVDEAKSKGNVKDFRQEMLMNSIEQCKQSIKNLFSLERKIRAIAPGLWAQMYKKQRLQRKQEEKQRLLKEKQEAEEKKRQLSHNAGLVQRHGEDAKSRSSGSMNAEDLDKRDILRAVENMAGKLLSKIQGLSFELTTEMRDLQSALTKMESYTRRLSGKLEDLYNDQVELLESQNE